jgi:predicted phosphoribosyltransferase
MAQLALPVLSSTHVERMQRTCDEFYTLLRDSPSFKLEAYLNYYNGTHRALSGYDAGRVLHMC